MLHGLHPADPGVDALPSPVLHGLLQDHVAICVEWTQILENNKKRKQVVTFKVRKDGT